MRLGVYEVTGPLGAGGMGEVYRATDSKLKREVALKVLPADVANDPERLARFQREAELLASLNHPNIAHVHGLEESNGTTALVMELVDGEDLSHRIARGPMPIDEALLIAKQIAAALEAAHEQGIVHRDLKPANIKVRPDGTVKVLDFGLAKSLARSGDGMPTVTGLSSPGAILGTPAYMSPEQARGEETGRETDIWAFGTVLYELLTGVSPLRQAELGRDVVAVLTAPLNEALLPAATPSSVRRLVRRCLERDLKRRWRHMGDARIVIEEALAPSTDPAAGEAAIRSTPMPRRNGASLWRRVAGLAGIRTRRRSLAGPSAPAGPRALVPPADVQARAHPIGTLRTRRPDDSLRRAVGRRPMPRAHRPRRQPRIAPARSARWERAGDLRDPARSRSRSDRTVDGVVTYGTLARVPMAGGAPRQMVEDVKFADWSPDGSDLAIVRRVDGRDRLEFPIGKVLVQPAAGEGTGLGFARISPDGRRVAFVHYQSPGSLVGKVADRRSNGHRDGPLG